MNDLISRQAALDAVMELYAIHGSEGSWVDRKDALKAIDALPSAEQKSGRYVDLSERVIGYYYDDEYEEWIEKTVTVEELLDTACDDYTVVEMPYVEPQRMKGKWIELTNTNHTYICSVCGRMLVNIPDGKNKVTKNYPFCHCGADMRGEQE
jgi:hypothetical protein